MFCLSQASVTAGQQPHLSCCLSEATQGFGRHSHTLPERRHVPSLTVLRNACHGLSQDLGNQGKKGRD